ncbi:MAG: transcription-repair coupling factor [Prevotella sp.]|nr:transcription-repair coupling factor [Prevotella sp.]
MRKAAISGFTQSSIAMNFAATGCKVPLLFIMRDADEAGYLYQDLKTLSVVGKVQKSPFKGDLEGLPLFFPSSYKRAVKFGQKDAAGEVMRAETLIALTDNSQLSSELCSPEHPRSARTLNSQLKIVTYPAALSELVASRQTIDDRMLTLRKGETTELDVLVTKLRELGFVEVDYVYEPGQFAVRGSIVDIYSFSSEQPYRIDFFDDEIDTMRSFDVESQLSKEMLDSVTIVPEIAKGANDKIPFLDLLPDDTVIVTNDTQYVIDAIDYIYKEGFSKQALSDRLTGVTEADKAEIMRELTASLNLCKASTFAKAMERFRVIYSSCAPVGAQELSTNNTPQPLFHKNFELLAQTLSDYQTKGYQTFICSDSDKQIERLKEILDSSQFTVHSSQSKSRTSKDEGNHNCELRTENCELIKGTLHEGYIDDVLKIVLFTDHQIFERFHKYQLKGQQAKRGKMALTMKELQEMEPGDFIVHVDFGIGKFAGLVRIPTMTKQADGTMVQGYQEVIRIIYQKNDKVDVSIHSLYKISKYRRADSGEPPKLSTLGTGAWERIKERAKTRIKDIARDLIKLYAKRRHEKGFAFSADTYMQAALEGSFLYEDTPDQIKATQEVKHDMEQARPMDRLVCGDVGFGKTEVAIRAAFKAAADGKQVAVLVPTTVLAFQHYQTFSKRLQGLPVRVDYLSRARTPKQVKQITEDLEAGRIDILVGTHRMLTKTVKWHDIGLLIIDEEQKFGVSTKEKLRQLKTNIDTLTMSATPIPRTLQFSLMGARDMSIMRTPPPNRQPIDTQVATFSAELVADAINFEMSRDGQVYLVCNRIATLPKMREIIERHVPDCRIAVGHGQMKPDELEKVVIGFINHDYDVLLSTTIVENGIDIPNANTIIINDANHFGLSDLHQMRGRVGRSNRKAFCYLLAPPLAYLPAESRRRLEALETFADLGSGFSLAMQDLDIRGAGNLLGAEQSGFMEDLGYETYQKILSQAVNELKNDEFQDLYAEQLAEGEQLTGDDFVDDCNVESDLQMYFPDYYVPGSSERMLLYRELDTIETDSDLEAYRKRLEDRFGKVPTEGEELMQVVLLRRLGRTLGCERLILKQHQMQMQFVSNEESVFYRSKFFTAILNYVGNHPKYCDFKVIGGSNRLVVKNVPNVTEAVKILKKMLEGTNS